MTPSIPSTPLVYYNESDPFAAAWLQQLIRHGYLPEGDVDERPIQQVHPDDLLGYQQCHFFAGIGGWAYALARAGWGDRPVWTGSCPCQPFSSAGKQQGLADDRHLWPEWFRLITECRPPTVFGEQVEAAIRGGWWDLVQRDLEGEGFACGMAVLGAHSVGAPHLRQRCWFVAESQGEQPYRDRDSGRGRREPTNGRCMALPAGARRDASWEHGRRPSLLPARPPEHGRVGHPSQPGLQGRRLSRDRSDQPSAGEAGVDRGLAVPQRGGRAGKAHLPERGPQQAIPVPAGGSPPDFWSGAAWLPCRDGKSRPVEPGTFPLAHGLPVRVGSLRGYGNAIIPQVAQAFIDAYLADLRGDPL